MMLEVDVLEDGTMEKVEEQIEKSALPEAVTKTLAEKLPKFEPTMVEKSTRPNNVVIYEFEGTHDGKEIDAEINSDGSNFTSNDDASAKSHHQNTTQGRLALALLLVFAGNRGTRTSLDGGGAASRQPTNSRFDSKLQRFSAGHCWIDRRGQSLLIKRRGDLQHPVFQTKRSRRHSN